MMRRPSKAGTPIDDVCDYLRGRDLVVLSRFISPENGPSDAIAPQYRAAPCASASFRMEGGVAINDNEIRFARRGAAPPMAARYIGVTDQIGRLLATLRTAVCEPDPSGDIVFLPGTFRVVANG